MFLKKDVLFYCLIFLLILEGCGTLEHSANYSSRKKILAAPLVVMGEESSKHLPIKRWLQSGIESDLADNGYSLIISSDYYPGFNITPSQIELIKKGSSIGKKAPSVFKYILVYAIDKNITRGIPILAEKGEATVSLYIIDNETGKLFWSEQANKDWSDIPFIIAFTFKGKVYTASNLDTNPANTAFFTLVRELINESPLLKKEK